MKKIIFVLFCVFAINGSVLALYEAPLGSQNNPIYLEIRETPQSLRNYLQQTYGSKAYSDCSVYLMDDPVCSVKYDHSGNPMMCPRAIQYCLQNPSVKVRYEKEYRDKRCTEKFPGTTYNSEINKCSCGTGYYLDRNSSSCTLIEQTKNTPLEKEGMFDQVCRSVSGTNSFYAGETEVSKGGGLAGCGCKLGFKFSEGNYGECIPISDPVVSGCIEGAYYSATTGLACNTTPEKAPKKEKQITPLTVKETSKPMSAFSIPSVPDLSVVPPAPVKKVGWLQRFLNWFR